MKALILADKPARPPLKTWLAQEPQMVITLGDLDIWDINELRNFEGPKFGVYGNHCGAYMEELGIINLHNNPLVHSGARMIGMEGCVRYKMGDYQYTQAEAKDIISPWQKADVVVSHSPPFGIHDASRTPNDAHHHGFHALLQYIEFFKPRYLLHGHTAPETGIGNVVRTWHKDTEVIWVCGAAMIEL